MYPTLGLQPPLAASLSRGLLSGTSTFRQRCRSYNSEKATELPFVPSSRSVEWLEAINIMHILLPESSTADLLASMQNDELMRLAVV